MAFPLIPAAIGIGLWWLGRRKGDTLTIPENDSDADTSSGDTNNSAVHSGGPLRHAPPAAPYGDGSENLNGANSGGTLKPAPPAVPSDPAQWTQRDYDNMNRYYESIGSKQRVAPPASPDDEEPADETLADTAARVAQEVAQEATGFVKNTLFGSRR